jgi:type II secretory pathway pseudopilin PulG
MRPGRHQRGFTYVALMIATAVIGVGLAATGTVWSQAAQRDKERELLGIGAEMRNAIARYYERTPGTVKAYPKTLEELLKDPRFPNVQRHLRRIYVDPMTGKAEWGLVAAPGGGVMGVYSLSKQEPLKRAGFAAVDADLSRALHYSDWQFVYAPPRSAPKPAAPSAPAAKP